MPYFLNLIYSVNVVRTSGIIYDYGQKKGGVTAGKVHFRIFTPPPLC